MKNTITAVVGRVSLLLCTFKNTTGLHFAEKWKVKWTDGCANSSFLLWKWILPEGCDKFKALTLRKMQQNKLVQWARTGTLFVSAFNFNLLYSESCCFFSESSITLVVLKNSKGNLCTFIQEGFKYICAVLQFIANFIIYCPIWRCIWGNLEGQFFFWA